MISPISSAGLKFVPTLLPEGCAILYDLLKGTLCIGRQKCGYEERRQGDVSPSKEISESLMGGFYLTSPCGCSLQKSETNLVPLKMPSRHHNSVAGALVHTCHRHLWELIQTFLLLLLLSSPFPHEDWPAAAGNPSGGHSLGPSHRVAYLCYESKHWLRNDQHTWSRAFQSGSPRIINEL